MQQSQYIVDGGKQGIVNNDKTCNSQCVVDSGNGTRPKPITDNGSTMQRQQSQRLQCAQIRRKFNHEPTTTAHQFTPIMKAGTDKQKTPDKNTCNSRACCDPATHACEFAAAAPVLSQADACPRRLAALL
ncbi:uncharacterized protein UV8b_03999 [Ustilaginoidea virens]|uniref:Uncharacterized protein n=1 Tax=Ustilaginoidea virens TaxID=1159556 RepID=A0A8E5MGQ2_USTVR|nr:uncharacterized protein UV8b_03999 [Ustilaginoidea virens]QUC19758.1 hypothetical protein UV8b_03999 [Ustilaginoidea virens]